MLSFSIKTFFMNFSMILQTYNLINDLLFHCNFINFSVSIEPLEVSEDAVEGSSPVGGIF